MFYSHSKTDDFGNVYGSKELKFHIRGVLEKAFSRLSADLNFIYSGKELQELLKIIVDFHDLGKYTSFFQHYLLNKKPIDILLKRHAQIGGLAAYNLLEGSSEKKALLSLYLIFLHHSQLIDPLQMREKLGDNLLHIVEKQQIDLQRSIHAIETDLERTDLKEIINYPKKSNIGRQFKTWIKSNPNIHDYFLVNYLFSLLIEADKLDASDTTLYELKPIDPLSVDNRFGNPQLGNRDLRSLNNNELRNYCRQTVVSHLTEDHILDQYLFTLTAPTGIGKTMTALDFALKLKSKIKQQHNIESRIIYALPFINIIEQALDEYKITLSQGIRILAHYQYADIFGDKENYTTDGVDEINYNQKLMMQDTWQADIVITSFVQFFETLIGNRNKLLKKFNHYANSIIILDEVQTLRLDQMPILGAALYYLSKFLKSRIILMTATRPKIFELAYHEILINEGENPNPKELLTNYEEIFSLFDRTTIYPLLDYSFEGSENQATEFVSNVFMKKWQNYESCLIVCNSVRHSISIFNAIQNSVRDADFKNPVYYLSTNIIPAQRFERIKSIKSDLKRGVAPILISTQVVEAGVDLNFDMGFRDIGPIDSIIQAAGRINRNNDKAKKNAPLYIFDFDRKMTIQVYGRLAYDQAKKALLSKRYYTEKEYLQLIQAYFNGISDSTSFAKCRKLFESMKTLRYDSVDATQCPVSSFKIIENPKKYSAVFIESDKKASEALEKYRQKIVHEISKEEFEEHWKLNFQQQIITVPKYLCEDLEFVNEYDENIFLVPKSELESRYDAITGFNREFQKDNITLAF